MDPARYQRLKELVHAAADVDARERRAWLAAKSPDDPQLAAEAFALLTERAAATRDLLFPASLAPSGRVPDAFGLASGTHLGRYVVGAEIGRGGMGVVVASEDPDTGRSLAVKVIQPHLLASSSTRERFLREARLGLLVDHPNVVRTLDVGESVVGGVPRLWLVMERVHGRTLRALLEEHGRVPEALLREIALQAAEGLASLHAAGIVHRDLKPENVVITDDRRVRIMDLGVARVTGAARALTVEGHFVGSPAYASPEQCRGVAVSPATDLYSLGAVLYELATGRPLFDALDPIALVRAHVDVEPIPVGTREPSLSEPTAELITALLEKDPALRLGPAVAVAEAIRDGAASAWWTVRRRTPRPPRPRQRSAAERPRIVGREPERRAIREAWRDPEGAVLLLEGEAGIGKTCLADDLAAEVLDEGATVLRSGFVPAGEAVGLGEALTARFGAGLDSEVGRRLGIEAPAAAAFGAWLRRAAPGEEAQPLAPGAPEALLARFVRSLAEEGPLLWVVEDLHFADAAARRAVRAVARAASGRRVMLLLTARPGLAPDFRSALSAAPTFRELALERLGTGEVADLVAVRLGDKDLARRLARTLAPRSDGVPFFVLELLRDWERRGVLVRGADGVVREGTAFDPREPPASLRDLVHGRLAALRPEERALLDAAAVAGFEFDPDLLARARGRTRLEVLETLGRIEREHGLVRGGARLYRFDHYLLHEVVEAELAPALRAALHDALADALAEGRSPQSLPADVLLRAASHRLEGANPQAARAFVLAALGHPGNTERDAEWTDVAAGALAAPGLLAGTSRIDLLFEAARRGLQVGRADVGAILAEAEALAKAQGDELRCARALMRRGVERLSASAYPEALALAGEAAARFERSGSVREQVEALSTMGKAYGFLGRPAEARRAHASALEVVKGAGQPVAEARAEADLAIVLQEMGLLEEAERHQRRAAEVLAREGDRYNAQVVRADHANSLAAMGRIEEALSVYRELLPLAQREGLPHMESALQVNLGEILMRTGDLDGARAAFEAALATTRETGARRIEGYALHSMGVATAWSGDAAEARARLEEAVRLRRKIDNRPGLAESLLQLGILEVDAGRPATAQAHLAEAAALAREVSDPNCSVLAALHAMRVGVGDLAAARRAFEEDVGRLRPEVRLEARWLLWRAGGDPRDLDAARTLLDEQLRHVPTVSRATLLEHVPYARAVAEARALAD